MKPHTFVFVRIHLLDPEVVVAEAVATAVVPAPVRHVETVVLRQSTRHVVPLVLVLAAALVPARLAAAHLVPRLHNNPRWFISPKTVEFCNFSS